MGYRGEIDGLRAIALLSVILFHASVPYAHGGFIGVDIFFVISGYLITTIIIRLDNFGSAEIVYFYERRIRRIFPALFFMILCILPAALLIMMPDSLKQFGRTMAATAFFVSNIDLWWTQDYFDTAATSKPLLHTWSLAVEEQFYLLFPPVMWLLMRMGRHFAFWAIILAASSSLLLSEWASVNVPSANFYLAPTRAWELLAGSICAFLLHQRRFAPNEALAAIGLVAIFASISLFTEDTRSPGLITLIPVVGTALVILYGSSGTLTARSLNWPLIRGIGLISYSAYLWHFPVFAFARLYHLTEPASLLMMACIGFSLLMAWFSWRFVEQPFRRNTSPLLASRRALFGSALFAMVATAAVGSVLYLRNGLPERLPKSLQTTLGPLWSSPIPGLHVDCVNGFTLSTRCRTSNAPEILLWGDSYAMHLVPGLLASEPRLALQQQTSSACPPVAGIEKLAPHYGKLAPWFQNCGDFNSKVLKLAINSPTIKYIVMSSRFTQLTDKRFRSNAALPIRQEIQIVDREFQSMVQTLHASGKKIVIFSPTPENGGDVGQCFAKDVYFGRSGNKCAFTPDHRRQVNASIVSGLAQYTGYIDLAPMVCPTGVCTGSSNGILLYRDYGHLSQGGSALLGQKYSWSDMVRKVAR
jgi:peptidoglycan/LPS O-acetylase OafA/YrhL